MLAAGCIILESRVVIGDLACAAQFTMSGLGGQMNRLFKVAGTLQDGGGDPSGKGMCLWHIRHYLLIEPNPLRSDWSTAIW
jgi:hypothetical protein